jgi:hypothetical protein
VEIQKTARAAGSSISLAWRAFASQVMSKLLSSIGPIMVAAVVLAALYVGSYTFLVQSKASSTDSLTVPRVARYRFGGEVAEVLFFPAEQVDRRLRHEFWTTPDCLRDWEW